jgi:outer membrane protein X
MKNLFLAPLLLCALSTYAQTFKPFKVNVSVGYAVPGGSGSKSGFLFAVEPKYALDDNLTLGLRIEEAALLRAANDGTNADAKLNGSYVATGDYYFNTNPFRPFVGAGLGLYSVTGAAALNDGTTADFSGTKFGGFPRVGFEYGHLRFALEYNLVAKTSVTDQLAGGSSTGSINNSYLGIKLGVCIGGGRIKK